ncbi:MAG: gliding motility protein GldN [Saprospirales bacterium]|jgi:gliding motility associated protien GldN|nr:MAG: gliding motility protein GldN [Saprospirales bacterium]
MLINFFQKVLFSLCGLTMITSVLAQVPEEIITEASTPMEEQFLDGVVERNIIHETYVLPYAPMREADVPWERTIWRVIDVREKINSPFINPLRPFASIIIDGAQNGDLTAFGDDNFTQQMDPEEVERLLFRIDTNLVIDPETFTEEIVITQSNIDPMSIQRFRIKEVWYFNNKYSRLGVRVLGISPLQDVTDEATGEFRYELPLFWIYYPQARELFARERAFVTGNDAAPMTWLDLWEMRRFSSYIFKASNVYDERLEAFHETRIEQLRESKRIEDDLFNFEQDFWSY